MSDSQYYLQRADELDTMAGETYEPAIREGFVEIARTYRAMAARAGNSQQPPAPDTETERRMERMLENAS